jgi:catechol 2,3-dioxygenase-like lactoylglutathione lyase family enzyme
MSSMRFHQGRLLDHVHLRARDLEASKTFYRAVLEAVGSGLTMEGHGFFSADELFVSDDGEPTSGLHLAFQAVDRETVHRFHEAALAAGSCDNGAPGERHYHPGYYGAYAFDPDGNAVGSARQGSRREAHSCLSVPIQKQLPERRARASSRHANASAMRLGVAADEVPRTSRLGSRDACAPGDP